MSDHKTPQPLVQVDGERLWVALTEDGRECAACDDAFDQNEEVLYDDLWHWRLWAAHAHCWYGHWGMRVHFADRHGVVRVAVTAPSGDPDGHDAVVRDTLYDLLRWAARDGWLLAPMKAAATTLRALVTHGQEHGVHPTAVDVAWAMGGWTAAGRARAEKAGMEPPDAMRWGMGPWQTKKALSNYAVLRWYLHDPDGLNNALGWVDLGARGPRDLPDPRVSRFDVFVLGEAGVGITPLAQVDPGWAGAAGLCPKFVAAAVALGREPAEIVALGTALVQKAPIGDRCWHGDRDDRWTCGWLVSDRARAIQRIRQWTALDWERLARALDARLSPREAARYVRTFDDDDALTLLEGLDERDHEPPPLGMVGG